ncbi:MAG: 4-(cytidine 5'-diphospho)-2-C-methyl-D-erythritol kinase [Propioniciclava sp.]
MSEAFSDSRVHVRAPGKLNIFFCVGSLLDDGYHEVASAYQAVSLFEDVWAMPADGFTITVSGSVDVSDVPMDDRNLAIRAARMLATHTGYDGGVHLDIVKHVPVAGGMGGGSADAAAALLACDALWGTGLSTAEFHSLAARLGADVPFALHGGTAIGVGRGDRLSPALAQGRFHWVIALGREGLSTPEVYHHLDTLRNGESLHRGSTPSGPTVDARVLQALRAGDPHQLAAAVRNDLQRAAVSLRPELSELLGLGEANGALVSLVSGSGPTVAFLAADAATAVALQVDLSAAGHTALHVHGPVPGARMI